MRSRRAVNIPVALGKRGSNSVPCMARTRRRRENIKMAVRENEVRMVVRSLLRRGAQGRPMRGG